MVYNNNNKPSGFYDIRYMNSLLLLLLLLLIPTTTTVIIIIIIIIIIIYLYVGYLRLYT